MTLYDLVAVMAAMGTAALVQSVSGFGFALLAVPLMSLAVDVRMAVVVSTLVALGTSTMHAVRERANAHVPTVRRLIVASMVGMPFGFVAFLMLPESVLRLVLGGTVMVMTVLLVRGVTVPRDSTRGEWVSGIASGALGTSLSTNGPPLVFLLQARGHSPEEFRGTISTVFAVVNLLTLGMFLAAGRISGDSIVLGAAVVPVVAMGTVLGYRLRPLVNAERFRHLVVGLLALSGVSAILSAL